MQQTKTWKTVAQDVEEKTQAYWRISLAWNNRAIEPIATGEAIVVCKDNLIYTNPERPIYHRSEGILREIVRGHPSPNPEESSVIQFPETYSVGI